MECDIGQVLNEHYKGCAFSVRGNEYSTLKWNERNTLPKPTLEELTVKYKELVAAQPMKNLRKERDDLLAKTDKYALPDWPHASLTKQTEWLEYRQALRDLPSTTEDPANVVWPTRPDATNFVLPTETVAETSNTETVTETSN